MDGDGLQSDLGGGQENIWWTELCEQSGEAKVSRSWRKQSFQLRFTGPCLAECRCSAMIGFVHTRLEAEISNRWVFTYIVVSDQLAMVLKACPSNPAVV